MKHANKRIIKQQKTLKTLLILLAFTIVIAAITIYVDYRTRPGFLEKIWIEERGADYITVAWEKPRNVYRYSVTYNGRTTYVSGIMSKVKLHHLTEDTEYTISVRADSKRRQGFDTLTETVKTKKKQYIDGEREQMKFANTLVDLKQTAETNLTYSSDNNSMIVTGDKVMFTKPGKYVVNAMAEESDEYIAANKKITVTVLDSVNVDTDKAAPHIFYKLNKDNCELKMTVTGYKDASTPQSFEYDGGKYVILYVSKDNKMQRIICFDEKKNVVKPKKNLGHCNGLTIANDKFFVVKGGSSTGVSFNLASGSYEAFSLPYGASGIAYDRKTELFYTSQHQGLTTYNKNLKSINHFKRISRKTTHYSQDSGAYGGILMHCVSGETFQGTNYIDFYDMLHEKYLGSIECDLNEVESLLVNEEGYIELLCNTSELEDCIWKTPINMKMICD